MPTRARTRALVTTARAITTALALAASAGAAHAGTVHWPTRAPSRDSRIDPIASVRWNTEGWVLTGTAAPAQMALGDVESLLAIHGGNDPLLHAQHAVVLRIVQRFDLARAELAAAMTRDPTVLDDPDVALTHAYLTARQGQYAEAVAIARRALPRLDGNDEARAQIVLEIARWSMARGSEGLDDAITLLREVSGPSAGAAVARATLTLALHRRGLEDEAREVARSADLPSAYASTALRPGALIDGETDAALGTAYVLAGRGREAIAWLARAVSRSPRVWRASLEATLAEAQRAHAIAPSPPEAPRPAAMFRLLGQ
jgi:tetratricopeptide (TPR) repeat protein